MTGIVDLFTGFEVDFMPTPATAAGVTSQSFQITGWAWWLPVSCNFVVNNAGGAVIASPQLSLITSTTTALYSLPAAAQVAIGAASFVTFGLFLAPFVPPGTSQVMGLPFVPVLGEGAIRFLFTGGDAATFIGSGIINIAGRRYRNRKS